MTRRSRRLNGIRVGGDNGRTGIKSKHKSREEAKTVDAFDRDVVVVIDCFRFVNTVIFIVVMALGRKLRTVCFDLGEGHEENTWHLFTCSTECGEGKNTEQKKHRGHLLLRRNRGLILSEWLLTVRQHQRRHQQQTCLHPPHQPNREKCLPPLTWLED